eukprot:TRINITY_DN7637_c0_g1_i5.p1 TRINITY_DN7637_c0_g1~~TRINITY_DN7637_c0_g1_i5.p1  ORF type:complete len:161 (-),score=41.36 TRINITY_DN7637_c0_g1_i5:314-796(-)
MSRKLTLQEDNERKKRTKLIDEAQDKDEKIRDEKAQEEQEEDDDGDQDKDKYKDENEDENEEEGDDDDDDDDDADGDDASSDDSSKNCWRCRDDICMKHIARSMGFKAIEIGPGAWSISAPARPPAAAVDPHAVPNGELLFNDNGPPDDAPLRLDGMIIL